MNQILLIFILFSLLLIGLILFKPNLEIGKYTIAIYTLAPVAGAFTMLLLGHISINDVFAGLTAQTSINPLQILALFLSMTYMSIVLDEAGFFVYLASRVTSIAKNSQRKLFLALYIMVAILTIFTSNDIIILTFTPFIVYFAKNAKINPLPYLICSFVAANTWSMFLVIGNPTNIYLATSAGIDFYSYLKIMALPTLTSGVLAFLMLKIIFKNSLDKKIQPDNKKIELKDKTAVTICIAHLFICIILMAISSIRGFQMWKISIGFFISLVIWILAMSRLRNKRPKYLIKAWKRMPFEIIPFILAMFIMVIGLTKTDVLNELSSIMANNKPILSFGISSFIMSNVINNIPMSVVYSELINTMTSVNAYMAASYASIIGSNVGALLTPVGALAGIMWTSMLKEIGYEFSFTKFIKYTGLVGVVTLMSALITLKFIINL